MMMRQTLRRVSWVAVLLVLAATRGQGVFAAARQTAANYIIGAQDVLSITVLEDDKVLVPNDVILPLFTKDIGTDDVVAAIDAISARLTPDSLRAMMGRLKVDGASPEIVANEFTGNAGT